MARGRYLVLSAAALLQFVVATPAAADEVVPLVNTAPITVTDRPGMDTPSVPSSVYPSTINVTGLSQPVSHVEVVIPRFTSEFPRDVDMQLVGPTGISVVLMSDVGGDGDETDLTLRFKDGAPAMAFDANPLVSGTYAPTNGQEQADPFPSPAPVPGGTSLAAFNGTNPVGAWSLFAIDDDDGSVSSLPGGWALEITVPSDACLGIPDDGFTDVTDANVHEPAIDCLVAARVASGTSPTTFNPTGNVSRAQMATFVAQAIEATGTTLQASPPDAFTDDDGTTHELRINQLRAANVIGGNGETGTSYDPSGDMRRDHMASYMFEAFEAVTGEPLAAGPNAFNDDTGNAHEAAINALAAKGVITGTGGGLFVPEGTVSRAQMASFLARFLQLLDVAGALD